MTRKKKIVAVVLAVILILASATALWAVVTDEKVTVTFEADKKSAKAGETVNVNVKLTTNFYLSTASIPIYYDNTALELVSTTPSMTNSEVVTEQANHSERFYENSGLNKETHGVIDLVYIAKNGNTLSKYDNQQILLITFRLKDSATGDAEVKCIAETLKTKDAANGPLYFGKNSSGTSKLDSIPEVVENVDIKNANLKIATKGIVDINGDGELDLTDYNMILSYISEVGTLSDEQYRVADIDRDGSVDLFDLYFIDKMINGIE